MLLHFCHSPLKVLPTLAASMKIKIKFFVNYQNTKPTTFITEDEAKTIFNKANAGHERNGHTIQKDIKGLELNPYKDAMLKESNRKGDLVPMEE